MYEKIAHKTMIRLRCNSVCGKCVISFVLSNCNPYTIKTRPIEAGTISPRTMQVFPHELPPQPGLRRTCILARYERKPFMNSKNRRKNLMPLHLQYLSAFFIESPRILTTAIATRPVKSPYRKNAKYCLRRGYSQYCLRHTVSTNVKPLAIPHRR